MPIVPRHGVWLRNQPCHLFSCKQHVLLVLCQTVDSDTHASVCSRMIFTQVCRVVDFTMLLLMAGEFDVLWPLHVSDTAFP